VKENNVVAAILTVAFYTSRGSSMSLTQIMATYNEFRGLLAAQAAPKKKRK